MYHGLGEETKKGQYQLRKVGEIRVAFRSKPFNLSIFINKVQKLIQSWTSDVFDIRPKLNQVYGDPRPIRILTSGEASENAASKDGVQRLRRARINLHNEGYDPLQESIEIANQALGGKTTPTKRRPAPSPCKSSMPSGGSKRSKRGTGGSFYEKKKSATQLQFESQEDGIEDSDEDEYRTAPLSELPERPVPSPNKSVSPRKARNSQRKKYEGRRKWTDEEKIAVKEGIRQCGVGNWAQIKSMYKILLQDRTSGQIKVR